MKNAIAPCARYRIGCVGGGPVWSRPRLVGMTELSPHREGERARRGRVIGEVVHLNFRRPDLLLTKKQIAGHPKVRRSTRWIELRVGEGMPSWMDGYRRMFPLEECLAWIERWRGAKGRG